MLLQSSSTLSSSTTSPFLRHYLPQEIIDEILAFCCENPILSLIRLRAVNKEWKHCIDHSRHWLTWDLSFTIKKSYEILLREYSTTHIDPFRFPSSIREENREEIEVLYSSRVNIPLFLEMEQLPRILPFQQIFITDYPSYLHQTVIEQSLCHPEEIIQEIPIDHEENREEMKELAHQIQVWYFKLRLHYERIWKSYCVKLEKTIAICHYHDDRFPSTLWRILNWSSTILLAGAIYKLRNLSLVREGLNKPDYIVGVLCLIGYFSIILFTLLQSAWYLTAKRTAEHLFFLNKNHSGSFWFDCLVRGIGHGLTSSIFFYFAILLCLVFFVIREGFAAISLIPPTLPISSSLGLKMVGFCLFAFLLPPFASLVELLSFPYKEQSLFLYTTFIFCFARKINYQFLGGVNHCGMIIFLMLSFTYVLLFGIYFQFIEFIARQTGWLLLPFCCLQIVGTTYSVSHLYTEWIDSYRYIYLTYFECISLLLRVFYHVVALVLLFAIIIDIRNGSFMYNPPIESLSVRDFYQPSVQAVLRVRKGSALLRPYLPSVSLLVKMLVFFFCYHVNSYWHTVIPSSKLSDTVLRISHAEMYHPLVKSTIEPQTRRK